MGQRRKRVVGIGRSWCPEKTLDFHRVTLKDYFLCVCAHMIQHICGGQFLPSTFTWVVRMKLGSLGLLDERLYLLSYSDV